LRKRATFASPRKSCGWCASLSLEFTPKRSAKVVSKTLLAAVANARDQQNVDEDRLYVKRATADTGPTWKRSLARAHMHSTPILKRTSHLTVVVDERFA
jgi:large subunit ribosomal protein L22